LIVPSEKKEYWTGNGTRNLFAHACRASFRHAILGSVFRLINIAKPEQVWMCTKENNLPDKALLKYWLINALFKKAGYWIEEQEPWHGKNSWLFYK
jgi:hypothetical protein